MPAPRFRTIATVLAVLALAPPPAPRAEPAAGADRAAAPPLPTPPSPPERPAELSAPPAVPQPTSPVTPLLLSPHLPPPRPDELKAAGRVPEPPPDPAAASDAAGASPDAASPAPLPPERPAEFEGRAAAQGPGAPAASSLPADAPAPPPRPPDLAGTPAPSPAAAPRDPSGDPPALSLPSPPPSPPERPAELSGLPGEGEGAGEGAGEPAPLPPERPAELSGSGLEAALLAVPQDAACLRGLDALGVRYEKRAAIVKGQCSVAHPLGLAALADDAGRVIKVSEAAMVCGVAEALARWAKAAQALAETELGEPITAMTLGGYHCRGQNNLGEAKLSEHAFANAVDVMGFGFAKRAPIPVGVPAADGPEARFLDGVRAEACRHFRTVLGPGSNEAHANHFHFDQRARAGGHRLCELRPPAPENGPKDVQGSRQGSRQGSGQERVRERAQAVR